MLETLIIGARLDKRPDRIQVKIPVDYGGLGKWNATTGEVATLLRKAQMLGGAIEAQRINGDWERIYRYFVKRGTGYGCSQASGRWFEVRALREVL